VPTRIVPLAGDELIEVGAQCAEPRQQAIGAPQHDLARPVNETAAARRALDERDRPRARAAICWETADCDSRASPRAEGGS
jgi:hypothetical protein